MTNSTKMTAAATKLPAAGAARMRGATVSLLDMPPKMPAQGLNIR